MKKLAFLALSAFALAACQSNQYKIEGSGAGLTDGDTLYFTSDLAMGIPSDTLIVKDGKITKSGETDSTYLCLIYNHSKGSASFFLEPGDITISFGDDGSFKVSGTPNNDRLQALFDTAKVYDERINKVVETLSQLSNEEEQKAAMDKIQKIQGELNKVVLATAEKNIDNEFGYYLITNMDDVDPEEKMGIISKMPAKFQEREAVKVLKQMAEAAKKTAIGQPMPTFTMNTPEGQPLNIMDEVKKNKVTILDFWASWCGPCRQEMPNMKELYTNYKDKGLGIVGISLDEDGDAWMEAIKELGLTWPQMSDLKGWQCEAGQMFQVNAIPFMAIVDQNGTIIQKGLRGEELEQFISEQLK